MKWYEEGSFYHIYPIGLTGAPRVNEGGEVVHRFPVLTGKWLPHIREMGFTAVYIGPLFESVKHGYDTIDYKMVDRRLGDNEDFRLFVEKAHELGIRVVVDGVFNHVGRGFPQFRDVVERREQSPYIHWFKGIRFDQNNSWNDGLNYETWRGSGDLVNLNLRNPEVKNYLFDVIRFWIREFDIDGIRLDCADVLDFDFMREMRGVTDAAKADFWLMGEVIHGEYRRWAGPEEHILHSVTNYELWKGLYSGHNSHNYFEIAHTIRHLLDPQWGSARGCRLYNFADNHDVNRIATYVSNPDHLPAIYTCVFLLPGVPSVYYGSEFGIKADKANGGDDVLRPYIDLDQIKRENPNGLVTAWIEYLNAIRMVHPACSGGEYRELVLTNRQFVFARVMEEDAVIAAMNNDDSEVCINIPVPLSGQKYYDAVEKTIFSPENDHIQVRLPAGGTCILTSMPAGSE